MWVGQKVKVCRARDILDRKNKTTILSPNSKKQPGTKVSRWFNETVIYWRMFFVDSRYFGVSKYSCKWDSGNIRLTENNY